MRQPTTKETWDEWCASLRKEWESLTPEEQAAKLALVNEIVDEIIAEELLQTKKESC